jgi:hypothetical protein
VDVTLEVAPGRVLSGLVRRIDGDIETLGADTPESIDALDAIPGGTATEGGRA